MKKDLNEYTILEKTSDIKTDKIPSPHENGLFSGFKSLVEIVKNEVPQSWDKLKTIAKVAGIALIVSYFGQTLNATPLSIKDIKKNTAVEETNSNRESETSIEMFYNKNLTGGEFTAKVQTPSNTQTTINVIADDDENVRETNLEVVKHTGSGRLKFNISKLDNDKQLLEDATVTTIRYIKDENNPFKFSVTGGFVDVPNWSGKYTTKEDRNPSQFAGLGLTVDWNLYDNEFFVDLGGDFAFFTKVAERTESKYPATSTFEKLFKDPASFAGLSSMKTHLNLGVRKAYKKLVMQIESENEAEIQIKGSLNPVLFNHSLKTMAIYDLGKGYKFQILNRVYIQQEFWNQRDKGKKTIAQFSITKGDKTFNLFYDNSNDGSIGFRIDFGAKRGIEEKVRQNNKIQDTYSNPTKILQEEMPWHKEWDSIKHEWLLCIKFEDSWQKINVGDNVLDENLANKYRRQLIRENYVHENVNDTINALDTVEKLALFNALFELNNDTRENSFAYDPRKTIKNLIGICRDTTWANAYVLREHGKESYIIGFDSDHTLHSITVYKTEDNKWNIIDGYDKEGKLYPTIYYINADSIDAAIQKYRPGGILDYTIKDPETNKILGHQTSRTAAILQEKLLGNQDEQQQSWQRLNRMQQKYNQKTELQSKK